MFLVIQFLHPEFLYGLAVLTIPVLLHLFSLKKYKKVYFSNFNFLLSLQQQKKNSSKIKNLLLLLLRLLCIAAIVTAFARPYTTPRSSLIENNEKPRIVLYIDNSFSMTNTGSRGSLFDEAKKQLYDILNTYPASTSFTFLTNDPGNPGTLSREEVVTALGRLKTSPAKKTLSQIFEEAQNPEAPSQAILFLLSDFQKNNCDFQNLPSDSLLSPVFLIFKPENKNNLYIKDISFEQAFHKKNQSDRLLVTVANSSENDYNNVSVSLTLNGKKKSTDKIDVPAKSETKTEISYLNSENGHYRGIVEITDFPVVFDNKFYFSYHIDDKINILCIEQDEHFPYFGKLFSDTSNFRMTYLPVNQTANLNLGQYHLIILDRLSTLWSGLESGLETYVSEGGNLFILPGKQISADVLNQMLRKVQGPQFEKADTNTRIDRIESQASLFKNVFEKREKNEVLPYIRQYYPLYLPVGSEKLLEDKQGNALLGSRTFGNGNIYVSAFDYAPANSDMAYHPLFVPILVNMAYNINTNLSLAWTLPSTTRPVIDGKEIDDRSRLSIKNEEHQIEFIPEVRKDFSGNYLLLNPENLQQAGLYDVLQDKKTVDVIACNYDRTESQLVFCDEKELQKYFPRARIENIQTTRLEKNSELVKQIVLQDNHTYLSVWFILLALMALLLEQAIWKRKLM